MGHTIICLYCVKLPNMFLKTSKQPPNPKITFKLENEVLKDCGGFYKNPPQNALSKVVNTECLHVQLVLSLDTTKIKMSYSSAAQLEVSSASVKHFMKRSTQEWARVLRDVPAVRLLMHTCSSCFSGQSHSLPEREHKRMPWLPCLQAVFQPASCGTSIWWQMINPSLNPTGADLDMGFYTVRMYPAYSALDLSCLKIMGWSKLFPCTMGVSSLLAGAKAISFFSLER